MKMELRQVILLQVDCQENRLGQVVYIGYVSKIFQFHVGYILHKAQLGIVYLENSLFEFDIQQVRGLLEVHLEGKVVY